MQRTPLFIDRLSITVNVPEQRRRDVILRAEGMGQQGLVDGEANPYSELLRSYRIAYHLQLGGGNTARVQMSPRQSGMRFLRLEWNPSLSRVGGCAVIVRFLTELLPDWSIEHLSECNVTRIDLSFDVYRVHLDNLMIWRASHNPATRLYRTLEENYSRRGRLNSIRFGSPQSPQYLVAYDKLEERRSREIEGFSVSRVDARGQCSRRIAIPRTRFELRLVSTRRLDTLSEARNPFLDFHIARYGGAASVLEPHVATWFEDSVKARGMQAALARIPDRRLRRAVANASLSGEVPTWWEPERIWGELPEAIGRVFI